MPISSRSSRNGRRLIRAVEFLSAHTAGCPEVDQAHLFVRGDRLRIDLWRQTLVTAPALLLGSAGTGFGEPWGLPLLLAAGTVQICLGVGLARVTTLQHDRATELIITKAFPLAALARETRRLSGLRRRRGLANALEDLVQTAELWPRIMRTCRPVFDPRVVRAAAPELHFVAVRLRTTAVSVRVVARVQRLLTSGDSPLYGPDVQALRHEVLGISLDLDHADAGDPPAPTGAE